MTAPLTDEQLAAIEARLADSYDTEGVGYLFIQKALRDIAALLAALRAERAEVARLRKQLDALPVFSVMSDTPPRKDRGPFCAHLHRSMDNQCFDCGWQVPE